MSLTKLECPECGKVLKPARPVTPGKKVRCRKCEAVFVAEGDEGEDEQQHEAGIKLAGEEGESPKKKKPAKTKPEAEKKAKAKAGAAGGSSEEEEEEGAY